MKKKVMFIPASRYNSVSNTFMQKSLVHRKIYNYKLNMNFSKISILVGCMMGMTAQAATVALGTSIADPNNYGIFSDQTLTGITLNGISYTTSELTQITITAWKGNSTSQILTYNGGNTNPDAATRRGFLETDWSGNTGLINPSTTAGSVGLSFNSPVKNIEGVDLFLYEINSGTPDPFDITINGVSSTISGSSYGNSGASISSGDVLSLPNPPDTLSALLSGSTTRTSDNINQDIQGVGIDFSDFGVALGETVSAFTLDSNGSSTTFDPVIIAAVPEPSFLWLIAAGLLGILALRRRE